jgi:hypothetical protein
MTIVKDFFRNSKQSLYDLILLYRPVILFATGGLLAAIIVMEKYALLELIIIILILFLIWPVINLFSMPLKKGVIDVKLKKDIQNAINRFITLTIIIILIGISIILVTIYMAFSISENLDLFTALTLIAFLFIDTIKIINNIYNRLKKLNKYYMHLSIIQIRKRINFVIYLLVTYTFFATLVLFSILFYPILSDEIMTQFPNLKIFIILFMLIIIISLYQYEDILKRNMD